MDSRKIEPRTILYIVLLLMSGLSYVYLNKSEPKEEEGLALAQKLSEDFQQEEAVLPDVQIFTKIFEGVKRILPIPQSHF